MVSFVVYTRMHDKLFTCENEPASIYKHHIPVSIRQRKDVDIMCDLAVDWIA